MLIGIVGTLGAGKGTVVKYLEQKGFKHYSASGYLKKVLTERDEVVNRDAYSRLASSIRTQDTAGLAKILHLQILEDGVDNAIVEALHDVGEAQYIKDRGGFLLGVDANLETRFTRIKDRGSEKDDITFDHFKTQVEREEHGGGNHNIRAVLDMADYTVMNNDTIEELQSKVDEFLKLYTKPKLA